MNSGLGLVSEEVILTMEEKEQAVFSAWTERVGRDVAELTNEGCGCCVDIYTVWANAEQIAELNALLDAARR